MGGREGSHLCVMLHHGIVTFLNAILTIILTVWRLLTSLALLFFRPIRWPSKAILFLWIQHTRRNQKRRGGRTGLWGLLFTLLVMLFIWRPTWRPRQACLFIWAQHTRTTRGRWWRRGGMTRLCCDLPFNLSCLFCHPVKPAFSFIPSTWGGMLAGEGGLIFSVVSSYFFRSCSSGLHGDPVKHSSYFVSNTQGIRESGKMRRSYFLGSVSSLPAFSLVHPAYLVV